MPLIPDPGDPGEPGVRIGRTGGSAVGEDPRLIRNGVQALARGALICPACELPISPAARLHPRTRLSCPFCSHAAEAIGFLRRDVSDAPANGVVLVARIG